MKRFDLVLLVLFFWIPNLGAHSNLPSTHLYADGSHLTHCPQTLALLFSDSQPLSFEHYLGLSINQLLIPLFRQMHLNESHLSALLENPLSAKIAHLDSAQKGVLDPILSEIQRHLSHRSAKDRSLFETHLRDAIRKYFLADEPQQTRAQGAIDQTKTLITSQRFRLQHDIERLIISPDSKYVLTINQRSNRSSEGVRLYDFETMRKLAELPIQVWRHHRFAFSPDGSLLIEGIPDQGLRVWDLSSQKVLQELKGPLPNFAYFGFIPGTQSILASFGKSYFLWEFSHGRFLRIRKPSSKFFERLKDTGIESLSFSQDGKTALLLSHHHPEWILDLIDFNSGALIHRFTSKNPITQFGLSPDGGAGFYISGTSFYRWSNLQELEQLKPIDIFDQTPTQAGSQDYLSAGITPSGNYMLTVPHWAQHNAVVWDLWDLQNSRIIPTHSLFPRDWALGHAISDDERWVLLWSDRELQRIPILLNPRFHLPALPPALPLASKPLNSWRAFLEWRRNR